MMSPTAASAAAATSPSTSTDNTATSGSRSSQPLMLRFERVEGMLLLLPYLLLLLAGQRAAKGCRSNWRPDDEICRWTHETTTHR